MFTRDQLRYIRDALEDRSLTTTNFDTIAECRGLVDLIDSKKEATTFVLHDGESDEETEKLHAFMNAAKKLQEGCDHGGYCFDWEGDEGGVYVTQAIHAGVGDVFVCDPETGHVTVEKKA